MNPKTEAKLIIAMIIIAIAGIIVSLTLGAAPIINDPGDQRAYDTPTQFAWRMGEQDETECAKRGGCMVITQEAIEWLINRAKSCEEI